MKRILILFGLFWGNFFVFSPNFAFLQSRSINFSENNTFFATDPACNTSFLDSSAQKALINEVLTLQIANYHDKLQIFPPKDTEMRTLLTDGALNPTQTAFLATENLLQLSFAFENSCEALLATCSSSNFAISEQISLKNYCETRSEAILETEILALEALFSLKTTENTLETSFLWQFQDILLTFETLAIAPWRYLVINPLKSAIERTTGLIRNPI